MSKGKCVFNSSWLVDKDFKPWLAASKDKHHAFCNLCNKSFSIASMGISALKSHMASNTHEERFKKAGNPISAFFKTTTSTGNRSDSPTAASSSCSPSTSTKDDVPVENSSASASQNTSDKQSSVHHLSTLSKKVTDAELLWTLNCVKSHFSAASNIGMNELFKKMFSDSEIVSLYSMSETKYRYLTTFGIGPHFSKMLTDQVKAAPAHCILFDESLNDELQKKQLDVHIRYWSEESCKIESRYYTSLFIGHGKANDILQHYDEATKDLDAKKTWQVGMDGPNVNISFHNKLVEQCKEMDLPNLLDLGTCGLHIVHRAFQTGANATGWKFDQYLLKEYKLFKDSPARREDFVQYTGSSIFPLKFCNHRWLENLNVTIRSLELIPDLREFCSQAQLNKTEPKNHEGYGIVKRAVSSDKLLKAKHMFWISIARDFQPFLEQYQADSPLIPFLAADLEKLLRNAMNRFVKENVMASATSYLKLVEVNISSEEQVKAAKSIDVGFAAKRELANLRQNNKITQAQELEFMVQCKSFLKRSTEKLLEKCPIKYPIVRSMRCLDPKVLAGPVTSSVKIFARLLNCLVNAERVNEMDADSLKRDYQLFVTETVQGNPQTLLQFQNYDKVKGERLDTLLASVMRPISNLRTLWQLVQCLLVLSHGQASVERGFSVNKEIMSINFKERSIVAQRTIYGHIQKCGGVLNVNIDQDLRNAAKNASSVYRSELRRQQQVEKDQEKEKSNKHVNDEIVAAQAKRRRLLEDSIQLKESVDGLMILAEKERNILHVTKANSFKRTIKEMEREAEDLDAKIENLKKKLKH